MEQSPNCRADFDWRKYDSEKRRKASWYDFAMEAEILFIMLLALIVLGPRRLPEIGRQIGKALAELRRAKYEFTRQMEDEIRKIEEEEAVAKTRRALAAVKDPAGTLLVGDDSSLLGTAGEAARATQAKSENQILPPGSRPAGTISLNGHAEAAAAGESSAQTQPAVIPHE
jgi:Sec-independent protein translocase protein TatA